MGRLATALPLDGKALGHYVPLGLSYQQAWAWAMSPEGWARFLSLMAGMMGVIGIF